ncbi:PRKR-interacting protein 1 homolog [Prorops nasuta]|uniref:PRKR-interacting protein 1 homolog n=1 Tax=Prorops nasuta TaxID=863751 RepID=UPI0034CEF1C2
MMKVEKVKKDEKEKEDKEEEKPIVAKTAVDIQRLKLMKLMKNPEKPVILPEKAKSKGTPAVPEFVRNVMGSSAGAGSGEFHVYRHLRRKEYARQKFIQEKGQKELLDEQYHQKLEENKKKADERTAKKRAKRLKKKLKKKMKPTQESGKDKTDDKTDDDSDSDNEQLILKTKDENVRSDDECIDKGKNSFNSYAQIDNDDSIKKED